MKNTRHLVFQILSHIRQSWFPTIILKNNLAYKFNKIVILFIQINRNLIIDDSKFIHILIFFIFLLIFLLIQHLRTWHVQILQVEREKVHEGVCYYQFA